MGSAPPSAAGSKAAELIADHLRKQIVRGQLRDGARLPSEAELIRHFGVSRPTLREAFRVLEAIVGERVTGVLAVRGAETRG